MVILALDERAKRGHGSACPYCTRIMSLDSPRWLLFPTLDHIRPRVHGMRCKDNTVIVCSECNRHKGEKTLVEWLRRLEGHDARRARAIKHFIASLFAGDLDNGDVQYLIGIKLRPPVHSKLQRRPDCTWPDCACMTIRCVPKAKKDASCPASP